MAVDLKQFAAVLFDLDGTLSNEDQALPGATELVGRLLGQGRKTACLSNSTQSPGRVVKRLRGIGIELPVDLVYTAAVAAVEFILERFGPHPRVFNLATEGVQEELEGKAVWVAGEHEPCDAVIIANPACHYCTPPRMQIGMRLIRNGAACVGICADRAYPSPSGLEIGSGATTHMFAYAANVEPIFFGKPQARFFLGLCERLKVKPQECVLVGDSLDSDIGGAKLVGMKTILTLTGVTRESDLQHIREEQRPDWVVKDLREVAAS